MSQRLRTCSKTTNFETINCDSYLPCLAKNSRSDTKRREWSLSNSKRSSTPPKAPKPGGLVKQLSKPVKKNSNIVQVTTNVKRTPWSELLGGSDDSSPFGHFDPLRSLHFLGRELRGALASKPIDDVTVTKIVSEMTEALSRVPPEVVSKPQTRRASSETRAEVPERLQQLCNPRRDNKVCQTLIDSTLFAKTESVQKQLEDSIRELDQKCKEMEELCQCMKTEKQQVERQLSAEKETVKFLRAQLQDLQAERVTSDCSSLSTLAKDNDKLKAQIRQLQQQTDGQLATIAELSRQTAELERRKQTADDENLSLRHGLTMAKLEKEKHLAILSVRDRQIKEILTEMNQLQEVVNDELVEFKKNPLYTQMSSQASSLLGWPADLQTNASRNVLCPTGEFDDLFCELQSFEREEEECSV